MPSSAKFTDKWIKIYKTIKGEAENNKVIIAQLRIQAMILDKKSFQENQLNLMQKYPNKQLKAITKLLWNSKLTLIKKTFDLT